MHISKWLYSADGFSFKTKKKKCLCGQLEHLERLHQCWMVHRATSVYQRLFHEDPPYFSKIISHHILCPSQQHGSTGGESRSWTGLAAGRSRTDEQLESSIRPEWDNARLLKLQKLFSSPPRCLQTLEEHVKHQHVPTFYWCAAAIKVQMSEYFLWNVEMSHLYCCSEDKIRLYEMFKSLHSDFIYVFIELV